MKQSNTKTSKRSRNKRYKTISMTDQPTTATGSSFVKLLVTCNLSTWKMKTASRFPTKNGSTKTSSLTSSLLTGLLLQELTPFRLMVFKITGILFKQVKREKVQFSSFMDMGAPRPIMHIQPKCLHKMDTSFVELIKKVSAKAKGQEAELRGLVLW